MTTPIVTELKRLSPHAAPASAVTVIAVTAPATAR